MATSLDHCAYDNRRSIYVANIHQTPKNGEFDRIFSKFGVVTEINHIQPKAKPRFSFVTFTSEESVKKALNAAKSKKGIRYAGCRLWLAPKQDRRGSSKKAKEIVGPAPIDVLHDDCMRSIFFYLSFKDRLICESVCCRWRQLVLETWSPIKHLKFPKELPNIPLITGQAFESQAKILKQTTAGLRSLDLGDIMDPNAIKRLLSFVPQSVTDFTFYESYMRTADITKAAKGAMPNLKTICIYGWNGYQEESLSELVTSFPEIEELSFSHSCLPNGAFTYWANIRKLSLYRCMGYDKWAQIQTIIVKLGHSLEELDIRDGIRISSFKFPCPNLKKLSFKLPHTRDSPAPLVDFSQATLLEELKIVRPKLFLAQPSFIESLVNDHPKLWKLVLRSSFGSLLIDDEEIWEISKLKNLTYLEVDCSILDCANVIGEFKSLDTLIILDGDSASIDDVAGVINDLPRLKRLDISGSILYDDNALTTEANSPKSEDIWPHTTFIEKMCTQCTSEGNRPPIELVISGCNLNTERRRWRCGRFIIQNSVPPFSAGFDSMSDDSNDTCEDDEDDYLFGYGIDDYSYSDEDEYDDFGWVDDELPFFVF